MLMPSSLIAENFYTIFDMLFGTAQSITMVVVNLTYILCRYGTKGGGQ